MTDNVIKFPGARQFMQPGILLDEVMKHKPELVSVLISGIMEDGTELFFFASEDVERVNWLLDLAKTRLMDSYKRGNE